MLRDIQRFGKHCSCHLQAEGWNPTNHKKIGQAVGGELYLMVLIGGAEERAAIQREKSTWLRKLGDENFFSGTRGEEKR
jgi:hypothetical protein